MSITIAFVKETAAGERRAALSPETCKKLLALKTKILIERGAGLTAHLLMTVTLALKFPIIAMKYWRLPIF